MTQERGGDELAVRAFTASFTASCTATSAALFGAFVAAGLVMLAPSAAPAQAPELESGYAVLAVERESGRVAGAAMSTRMAGASGGLLAESGVGAVFAAGRRGHAAATAAMSALRSGAPAADAARAGAGTAGSGPVVVLDPACGEGRAGGGTVGAVRTESGRGAGLCFLAAALQPGEAAGLERLATAAGRPRSPLARRLAGALGAALPEEQALSSYRSAALWIATPDGGAAAASGPVLDRTGLRLQVEDHPRPIARLEAQLELAEARELAEQASREISAGRYEEALSRADSALELDPGSTAAWMQRGRALLFDGRSDAAEEAFRRMLELDPTLLRFLGDPAGPSVHRSVIPYAPRLLLRLDVYRRAYFRTLDFGPEPEAPEGLGPEPARPDSTNRGARPRPADGA